MVVNRCWLCEMEEESVDHLLLHCAAVRDLWNAFFARFGLCWVMPRSVNEALASWWTAGRSRSAVVWKMVPHCILVVHLEGAQQQMLSRTRRGLERSSSTFFLDYSLILGLQAGSPREAISFVDFLSFLSLPP
jgi:hypothetical protein